MPKRDAYSNRQIIDRAMRQHLMWRFAELNRDRPLPSRARHLRWCGLVSAAVRGTIGNTAWARSMHAKNVVSHRWNPRKRYLSQLKKLIPDRGPYAR